MQAQTSGPVKSFSIGFDEEQYDHLSLCQADREEARNRPSRVDCYCIGGACGRTRATAVVRRAVCRLAQIPTLLVSRMARKHVTVCLSGDGGDESFGGYVRYFAGRRLGRVMPRIPGPLRRAVARSIERRPAVWERLVVAGGRTLNLEGPVLRNPSGSLAKLAGSLRAATPNDMYNFLVSQWHDPGQLIDGASFAPIFEAPCRFERFHAANDVYGYPYLST